MRPIPPLVLFGLMFGPVEADSLDSYLWQARPIVIFAPDRQDLHLRLQLSLLRGAQSALLERDCVVVVDTKPGSALRQRWRPGAFTVVLVRKNGEEAHRSDQPIPPDTIAGLIDAAPLRQSEIDHL